MGGYRSVLGADECACMAWHGFAWHGLAAPMRSAASAVAVCVCNGNSSSCSDPTPGCPRRLCQPQQATQWLVVAALLHAVRCCGQPGVWRWRCVLGGEPHAGLMMLGAAVPPAGAGWCSAWRRRVAAARVVGGPGELSAASCCEGTAADDFGCGDWLSAWCRCQARLPTDGPWCCELPALACQPGRPGCEQDNADRKTC